MTAYVRWLMALLITSVGLAHAADMKGSKDHPKIPRIEGTSIRGYQLNDFDEVQLIAGFSKPKAGSVKPVRQLAEGRRTRILYIAPSSITAAQVIRNYEVALGELGKVDTVYECRAGRTPSCPRAFGEYEVWSSRNRIPVDFKDGAQLYNTYGGHDYTDENYAYWKVASDDATYHVALYTAAIGKRGPKGTALQRTIHLEVVDEEAFKATLKVVTPQEIQSGLSKDGRIALYGLYFDVDKDTLQASSEAELKAIATALSTEADLKVYVVGHTDNQGKLDYNVDLAKRRAQSVVNALVQSHGIAKDRLVAAGVGPVSPVASNSTAEGQALNRRVELVER